MGFMSPSRHFQCLALDRLSYINGVLYIVGIIFGVVGRRGGGLRGGV